MTDRKEKWCMCIGCQGSRWTRLRSPL